MTVVGRSKLDHPALGTAGGTALHASIENLYTSIGNDLGGRFETASSVANSAVTTFDHNFGVQFSDLKVLLYTGSHPNLVRVSDPAGSGWTIAAKSGEEKTKIDVTAPSSGGPHTFSLFVSHGRGAEKLSDLDDVDFSPAPATGQLLAYSGSAKFEPQYLTYPSEAATIASNTVTPTLGSTVQRITGTASDLQMVASPSAGKLLILVNETGSAIAIKNDTGATAANRIYTGSGGDISLNANASISLVYNGTLSRWIVAGFASAYGDASAVASGLVSTGAQTFAGAKSFDGVTTIGPAGGGAAAAGNAHTVRADAVSTLLVDNTAAAAAGVAINMQNSGTVRSRWSSSSTSALQVTNAGVVATILDLSQAGTLALTAADSAVRAANTLNDSGAFIGHRTTGNAALWGALGSSPVIFRVNGADVGGIAGTGAMAWGPSGGLGTAVGGYHTATGGIVALSGSGSNAGSLMSPTVMQIGANLYRDGTNANRAYVTATGYTSLTTTRAAASTATVFALSANYQDAQTAGSPVVVTNDRTLITATALGNCTFGASAGLGTGAGAYHTFNGSIRSQTSGGTASFSGSLRSELCGNVYRDGSASAKAISTGGYAIFQVEGTTTAANGAFNFITSTTSQTADSDITATTIVGTVSAGGSWALGPTTGNVTHTLNRKIKYEPETNATTTTPQNQLPHNTSVLRMTGLAAITVNGIAAGAEGEVLYLSNETGSIMTINHNSASATVVGDRVFTQDGAAKSVLSNQMVHFVYISARWRLMT